MAILDNAQREVIIQQVQTCIIACSMEFGNICISCMWAFVRLSSISLPLLPQVIHIERPLRCQNWCCFCCLQEVEVQSPPGTVVGYIKQDLSFVYPWFSVEDADGQVVLKIKGPLCTCKWCEVEFQVCVSLSVIYMRYICRCTCTCTCVYCVMNVYMQSLSKILYDRNLRCIYMYVYIYVAVTRQDSMSPVRAYAVLSGTATGLLDILQWRSQRRF